MLNPFSFNCVTVKVMNKNENDNECQGLEDIQKSTLHMLHGYDTVECKEKTMNLNISYLQLKAPR